MERKLRPAMYYPARAINVENEREYGKKNISARNDNLSVQRGFRPHSMESGGTPRREDGIRE